MTTAQLLKLALPLVQTHGFTREALSRSVLSLPVAHAEPLGDMAVSALFGSGDEARRTLINAWLEDSIGEMKNVPSPTVRRVLQARLARNEPVLEYLPEVRLRSPMSTVTSSHHVHLTPTGICASSNTASRSTPHRSISCFETRYEHSR